MNETNYMVTGHTSQWIANRDGLFKGLCYIELERNLTLEDAKDLLLETYNNTCGAFYVTIEDAYEHDENMTRFLDGTYGFEYESRHFYIEEQE